MGRSRAAGTFIAVLMLGALSELARGGDLVECEPQRVTGDGQHWAYRIVDGRECWYPGRPGKPKNELFWHRGNALPAEQTMDQTETETETEIEPSEPPSRLEAAPPQKSEPTEALREGGRPTAADQLLAFTCCWPELPTAVSVPQPGPGGRQDQPPAWPLILLPLALCAMWSKKLRRLVAPDFARSSVSSWWRWWEPVRRGAHYVSGGRRAQQPAGGVASSPTSAQRPTKLARIHGALVPLAPRGLPPASCGSLGFSRSLAKAGDWDRMRFILTDRSEVANDPLCPGAPALRAVRAD
jgi:hypothetical protein